MGFGAPRGRPCANWGLATRDYVRVYLLASTHEFPRRSIASECDVASERYHFGMPAHCFVPGVRPIGVCEVMRRIVAKAALYVIRDDIQIRLCIFSRSPVEIFKDI